MIRPRDGPPAGQARTRTPGWVLRVLALSPDGRSFATGSNPPDSVAGELRLWNEHGPDAAPPDASH